MHRLIVHTDYTQIHDNYSSGFPCQLNLSYLLTSYPLLKSQIVDATSINVYDPDLADYIPVFIDLDKTNDKLLVYFKGNINNSSDKYFHILFNLQASSNDLTVFSDYFQRMWLLNAVNNIPTTDICVASEEILTKNSCSFGYDTLFYKGCFSGSSYVYASSEYIPCITSATTFSFLFQLRYASSAGEQRIFISRGSTAEYYTALSFIGNKFFFFIRNGQTYYKSGYVNYTFQEGIDYDIWLVVDLTQLTDVDRIKVYINGSINSITFVISWDLSSTHSATSDYDIIGDSVNNFTNYCIFDSIGVCPTAINQNFIVTSANQYLNPSGFWIYGSLEDLNKISLSQGISSNESFGTPSISFIISPTSVISEEGFGILSLMYDVEILPSSVISTESFGDSILYNMLTYIFPNYIISEESFGNSTLYNMLQFIYPTGIPSEEVFYNNYLTVETPCIPYFYCRQEGTINSIVSGPLVNCNILPFPLRVRLDDWEAFSNLSQRKIGLGIESTEDFGLEKIIHG